jgi:hypothetical protein
MKAKDKMRFAIRVFLCANKGKWYSSKQLSEFLNEFGLGGRSGCTSANVARLLTSNWLFSNGISRERKNAKNIWYYGVV